MKNNITSLVKKARVSAPITHHAAFFFLLILLICIAYWIRIQSVDTIPEGQLTSNDAYFYYWQTKIVSEQGILPARDMDRWVPLGRDNEQLLSLYAYVVAYVHKLIAFFSPHIISYQVILYMPVFCFIFALVALCFFLYRRFGTLFSISVGILLATLPSMIDRSTAGFSDRDSWCLLLGILAVITYLGSLQLPYSHKRLFFTLSSGGICFLGGLSWEGFGIFTGIIVFVEIWRFLSAETDEGLKYYTVWVVCFVPTLYIASPAYRSGEYFAQHLFAFVLFPPVVILLMRYIRYRLFIDGKRSVSADGYKKLSFILTLIPITLGVLYTLSQLDTFTLTVVPFGEKQLMGTVSELQSYQYVHWVFRYGSVFFLGCLGFIIVSLYLWDRKSIVLISSIVLFTVTTLFRTPVDLLLGVAVVNILFFISLITAVFGILLLAWFSKSPSVNEIVYIAFAAWFLFWIALSRDARRYDFFVGISLAFFCATLFQLLCDALCNKLKLKGVWKIGVRSGITVVLLAALMWWPPAGAHARRSVYTAQHGRNAIPSNIKVKKAYDWMKENLPHNTCVSAGWDHGSQLNVLANVKTIVDQDHYLINWIHLACRYVYCADNDKEALEFLKTHQATHLFLTLEDITMRGSLYSSIGSNKDNDRFFNLIPLEVHTVGDTSVFVPIVDSRENDIVYIDALQNKNKKVSTIASFKTENNTHKKVEIPYIFHIGDTRVRSQNQTKKDAGGILLFFTSKKEFIDGYYIPPAGWNSLAVRLFFRGESSKIFVPVYPKEEFTDAEVKVWEIRYPSDIKSNPKYLETKPPE